MMYGVTMKITEKILCEDYASHCFCCLSLNNIAVTPNLLKYDMVVFRESCHAVPILVKIGEN